MMRKNSEGIEIEYRTFKVVMEKDKYDFIVEVIEGFKQQSGTDMNTARALELICAEFNNNL